MRKSTRVMYELLIPLEAKYGSIASVSEQDGIDTATVHVLQRLMEADE
ncbi:hypothetical protein [Lentilactobacillus sp. SPB1-3]|uniref:Uncharacterized protein n=1 Tax=Lentilactobacillus terminaliae TaxID=3003483 RepID=A0ACD5DCM4_9LACO|nr:hypothetical protein [Lentilactobacillus sp. SPB1-3]MCZ0978066.1 hypothetical protein [Lentilactobacillus sp. SPB1-3]